jgi:hypothetical protein
MRVRNVAPEAGVSDVDSSGAGATWAGMACDRRAVQLVADPRSKRYARSAVKTTAINTPMIEQGITRARSVMSRSKVRSGSLFTRSGSGGGPSWNDEVFDRVGQQSGASSNQDVPD